MRHVPVRVHQVDTLGGSKVESHAAGLQTDQEDLAARIVLQGIHRLRAVFTLHRPVKTVIANVRDLQRILDPVTARSDFTLTEHRIRQRIRTCPACLSIANCTGLVNICSQRINEEKTRTTQLSS